MAYLFPVRLSVTELQKTQDTLTVINTPTHPYYGHFHINLGQSVAPLNLK